MIGLKFGYKMYFQTENETVMKKNPEVVLVCIQLQDWLYCIVIYVLSTVLLMV